MLRKLWFYRSNLNDWDLYAALVLAAVVTKFAPTSLIEKSYTGLSFAFVGIQAAILSFTIAGAAIVATLMSPSFAAVLRRTPGGLGEDLFPFWWISAVSSWGIVVCVLAAVLEDRLSVCGARYVLGAQCLITFYSVLSTLGLVALTIGQAENHATLKSRDVGDPD
jgi:hypothetical protein